MKARLPLKQAEAIAKAIVDIYAPACERIEIAGSIRRQCEMVGDIEIVAIAKPILNLFGEPTDETELDAMLRDEGQEPSKNGPKYKQMQVLVKGDEMQLDLFLAEPCNWGYILMLRTGSARFSQRMVQDRRLPGGLRPPGLRCRDGYVWRAKYWDGEAPHPAETICVPDEETLFELWGMDFIPPAKRA